MTTVWVNRCKRILLFEKIVTGIDFKTSPQPSPEERVTLPPIFSLLVSNGSKAEGKEVNILLTPLSESPIRVRVHPSPLERERG
jgi:hypothetical protein